MNNVHIREASEQDWPAIWPIFKHIAREGKTYAFSSDISMEEAKQQWLLSPRLTFVAESDGVIVGTYYLKTNFAGPGSHVCNCGYMVSAQARGQGIATELCKHSQRVACELGYRAMQFNYVASTNTGAIALWKKLGYDIVGTLPQAFYHPQSGYIDAFVMYKWLSSPAAR
ncbi:GNAT family N-acetyltransferase [Alteromonas halophila]|uniref:N-acetyltransferase n=1 Tax=Alteromonas halophila TaxID=516698 RepID=A0A918JDA3_9ALTE|nr:N-acetyltransferase [Alteromonas halophila]GGW75578.1 N-acetyltransferase [Alteromonas halophila]